MKKNKASRAKNTANHSVNNQADREALTLKQLHRALQSWELRNMALGGGVRE